MHVDLTPLTHLVLGPRGRILNHVDQLRPATQRPSEVITEPNDMHFSQDPAHTPVEIPTQPGAVITPDYHGAPVLSQPAIVVGREYEMLNIFMVSDSHDND